MPKILMVDDDVMLASGIKQALENENYTVDHSVDGRSGLEMLRHYFFDLVAPLTLLNSLNVRTVPKYSSPSTRSERMMMKLPPSLGRFVDEESPGQQAALQAVLHKAALWIAVHLTARLNSTFHKV